MKRWLSLFVFIAIMFLAAMPAFFFPPGQWYTDIHKPSWNPPAFLFGPVWSTLYVLIAISIWRVWPSRNQAWAVKPIWLWSAQWLLNMAWSFIFFGMQLPGLALLEILLLWACIFAYILTTYRHERFAAYLFVPYLLWVSFATVLNGTIWFLNFPSV
jgi:translocator protein